MSSFDKDVDISTSSRISQVGESILADEARRALSDKGQQPPQKLNLSPAGSFYGPETPRQSTAGGDSTHTGIIDHGDRYRVLPGPPAPDDTSFIDSLADRLHPGFGRIEGANNSWRLDYLDTGRCKTKASVGICLNIHLK